MRVAQWIAAFCFPVILTAQQSPTGAAQSNGVARTFLSFGRPYGGWLLLAFDSIPASQYGFRPTPVQQSIGFIAQHLETANYELCSIFGMKKHAKSVKDVLPLASAVSDSAGHRSRRALRSDRGLHADTRVGTTLCSLTLLAFGETWLQQYS